MSSNNFLEDFFIGQSINHATPRTINEADASIYIALTGDRRPLFCASTFAKQLGFDKKPINDLLVFNIAFGRTVQDISLNAIANLGYADVRFIHPVFSGDTLKCTSEVIGLKENSKKTNGIVYVHSHVFNQDNTEVMSWKRWVMIPKRDSDINIKNTLVPNLPQSVDLNDIKIYPQLKINNFDYLSTGSKMLWDDYSKGETINHTHGITIDETAHTMATHLYQNNARLHFDANLMKNTPFQKRLVYGGHIISLCNSISFQGLENVLNIAAINSGVHSNPSFAGDTIYAKTIIKDKIEIEDRTDLGLLRLRLIGIKNQDPSEIESLYKDNESKIYEKNVVLDMDYTVLIPKGK